MAGAAGLEPVTSAVTGQRSNQLSYAPAFGGFVFSGQNQRRQRSFPALVPNRQGCRNRLSQVAWVLRTVDERRSCKKSVVRTVRVYHCICHSMISIDSSHSQGEPPREPRRFGSSLMVPLGPGFFAGVLCTSRFGTAGIFAEVALGREW